MKFFRVVFLAMAVLSLAGWWHWRRPASPTDALPPVKFVCYTFPQSGKGETEALRQLVGTWNGVTACAVNQESGLLTAAITPEMPESVFYKNLKAVGGDGIFPKKIEPAEGPQCPVPARMLINLPIWLLWTSISFGLLFLLTFISKTFTT